MKTVLGATLGLLLLLSPGAAGAAQTTLGNGIAGANATVCPGASNRKLDGFSLVTDSGTDAVTDLTVRTTGYFALQSVSIYDEAGTTQYFTTVTTPSSNTVVFSGGTPLPVSATTANFKILVTYRSEAQSPPPLDTATTAYVSSITSANPVAGSDAADATLTLNNLPPSGASWGTNTAGDGQVTLAWTLSAAGNNALVVRYAANVDTTLPADGTIYAVGNSFGVGGTVRYAGSASSFVDTGLTNGTTYYYRVFEFDGCSNYVASAANAPWSAALTPRATTTLGGGVAGTGGTVCPGAIAQKLDGFSLVNSQGTVPVTSLTVTTTGFGALQTAAIYNEAGSMQYFTTVTMPGSNTLNFSGGTPIPVSTTIANYKVLVTYRSEAQSPPPGSTATTAYVSSITTVNAVAGSDTADGTRTLDNVPPTPGATWGTNAAGDGQVALAWSFGTAGDFALVVRYTNDVDTTLPSDGTSYVVGNDFGAGGTVRYVGTATTFVDTGLTDGSTYYYRVFEFDGCNNYVASGGNAPWSGALSPRATTALGRVSDVEGIGTSCPGASDVELDRFSLVNSQGTVPVTGLTVTTTGFAALQTVSIYDEAGTTQYFTTLTTPASNTLVFSGGTPIPVSTTSSVFRVVVSYRSEAQSPPPGITVSSAYVSSIVTTNSIVGSDAADVGVYVDNEPPASGATWSSVTSDLTQNSLTWSYGTVGDNALIVRYTADGDTALPADGTTYAVSEPFGVGGSVAYVGSATDFVDTGLTYGTLYYYRIFEFDSCRNYVADTAIAPCVTNCGACTSTCSNAHGTTGCFAGVCVPTCTTGYGDYDGDPVNGCEASCDGSGHCGTDCLPCESNQAVSNPCALGNTVAAALSCTPACVPGYASIDGNGANGCELPCADVSHCGLECAPCSTSHTASVTCSGNGESAASACHPTCLAGYLDIDGSGRNGCEAACDQPGYCGTTCGVCPSHVNAVLSCSGPGLPLVQACGFTCQPGFWRADATSECVTACTTVDRCGTDCAPCTAAPAHASSACGGNTAPASEACGLVCEPGYSDADGLGATGCEGCAQGYYDQATAPPASCAPCETAAHCGSTAAPFCRDCTVDTADGVKCLASRCACETDGDCAAGKTCRHHSCVQSCAGDSDCTGGQRCCGPSGEKSCVTEGPETCDGRDNDCNGLIDDQLDAPGAAVCPKQLGVCEGARAACVDGLSGLCDDAAYGAHSADYEPVETRCDGLDNDCDGVIDEGCDDGTTPADPGGCGCQQFDAPGALAALFVVLGGFRRRPRARPGNGAS